MSGKLECNLCQGAVDVLERSYSTASEGFRQMKVDGWMKEFNQKQEDCKLKLCLPLIRLFSKASGDSEIGLE